MYKLSSKTDSEVGIYVKYFVPMLWYFLSITNFDLKRPDLAPRFTV